MISLFNWQQDALKRMHNGCILNGGVGSGKSRTSLAYYYTLFGGDINSKEYSLMKKPPDLYIITTARKRDTHEWEMELVPFGMTTQKDISIYDHNIVIDSWNNIKKYDKVKDAFFIFDEQRVVGYGAWTKAFLKIADHNKWILLSATPGDTWMDYIPVFIANGFYDNKTDFERKHVVYSRWVRYKKVERYLNEGKLQYLRKKILVDMTFKRDTIPHHIDILVDYDEVAYDRASKRRWNIFEDKPIENASEYCGVLRRIVNSDVSRQLALLDILEEHPKILVFYTYDYELEILRNILQDYPYAEWNGHKHEMLPTGDKWVYLVEYIAGNEGWNCITTDTMVFYSQNYSYKVMKQAEGRIDRLNTPYIDLYYYHFKSKAKIDLAIRNTLNRKKKFNEVDFAPAFVIKENERKKDEREIQLSNKNGI